jgi:hypothetical protein
MILRLDWDISRAMSVCEEMDESQGQLRPRQLWNSGYMDLSELQLINYYWIVG